MKKSSSSLGRAAKLYIVEALDPRDSEAVETAEIPLPPTELPKLFSFGRPLLYSGCWLTSPTGTG